MRIVVVSDTHGNRTKLTQMCSLYQNDADLLIHLGDGEREFADTIESFAGISHYAVRGNNDFASLAPKELTITLEGKRLFITHGHLYGVKHSLDRLIQRGRELQADLVLYGHTHRQALDYIDQIYLLCPGSLSHPFDGKPGYAVIDLVEGQIVPTLRQLSYD